MRALVLSLTAIAMLRERLHTLLVFLLPAAGFSQAPIVKDLQPRAAPPGETIDLVLAGEHLADATDLWTSFPSEAHFVPDASAGHDRALCHLTLPRHVPVGIGGLRVANRSGVSSVELFMIDDLPSVRSRRGNTSREEAQHLAIPVAVDGRLEANQRVYFTFHARRGQRVAIDVVAQRLGSQLDPVLRVLGPAGSELAFVDDTPGVGPDCRLEFEAPGGSSDEPAAGAEYTIELRDIGYRGGERAFFRLRVGDFPLATVPFPLGATAGRRATLAVVGRATRDIAPLEVEIPEEPLDTTLEIGVRFPAGRSSDSVRLVVDPLNDVEEVEPNDTLADSTPVDLPVAVNGRLQEPGDRDHYIFSVEKGEKLSITAMTRSAGAPTDLLFALIGEDGTQLAAADVSGSDDGSLRHTAASAGRCVLRVEGLNRDGGAEHAYRLKVERFEPHVVLSVEKETVNVGRGGELTLEVACDRRDYEGPVELLLEGLNAAWELKAGTIEKGRDSGTLKATVPAPLPPGRCHLMRIVGEIETGGGRVRSTASTLPALLQLFPLTAHPPRALDGLVGVGVADGG